MSKDKKQKMSRQQKWRNKMVAAGRCSQCGKEKPKGRKQRMCRPCTVINSTRVINYYHTSPKMRERQKQYRKEQREALAERQQITRELAEGRGYYVNK